MIRLFFRLELLNRTKNNYFEDNDEDEDLVWEAEEELQAVASNGTDSSSTKSNSVINVEDKQKIRELENENDQLKRQVHLLLQRVADLELELSKVKHISERSSSAYSSYEDVRKAEVVPSTVTRTLPANRTADTTTGASSPSPVLVSPINSPRVSPSKPVDSTKSVPTTTASNKTATTPAITTTPATATASSNTTSTQHKPTTTKTLFELNEDDEDGWT